MMMSEEVMISISDHQGRSVQIRRNQAPSSAIKRHQAPSSAIKRHPTRAHRRNQAPSSAISACSQMQSSAIKAPSARAHRRHERSLCRFAFHDQPCAQCRLRHAGSTKKSASAGSVVASNAARRFDSTCSSHLMKGGNHDEGGNPDEGGNHELPPDEVVAIMMREAIMSLNQWQLSLEVVDAAAIIRVAVGHAELPKLVHVHAQRPR